MADRRRAGVKEREGIYAERQRTESENNLVVL